MSVTPPCLQKRSNIRVVAPSRSGSVLSDDVVLGAKKALETLGFSVSFSSNWLSSRAPLETESIDERVADIHAAFLDESVDGVLTAIGGYNANQILLKLDYELIAKHPKIFCGFSDITLLLNAIYAKTGMMAYLGPHSSSWGMQLGFEYGRDMFLQATNNSLPYILNQRSTWSNDA